MSEQPVDPELNAFAAALAHLKPRAAALDRDALMFRAGRASAPRGWTWPLMTAAALLVAASLGVVLLVRSPPVAVERSVIVEVTVPVLTMPAPAPKPVPPPTDSSVLVAHEPDAPPVTDYQRLQEHLLRWGFDGLPSAPHTGAPPRETPDSLLHSL